MADRTVLVTDHHFESLDLERDALEGLAAVEELDEARPGAVARQLAEADAILTSRYRLDADRIASLDRCQVIARYGIGVDSVDVAAATDRGIVVTNAPTYGVEEVATHAIAFILSWARQLRPYDDVVAAGGWRETPPTARDPRAPGGRRDLPIRRFSAQTVGVIGVGTIGEAVVDRLTGFGPRLLGYDPYLDESPRPEAVALEDFDTVVGEADYVTIHAPLTEETRGLFDSTTFDRMQSTAYLINCARGPIVDEAALLDALEAGSIAGAALDVFAEEPLPAEHPLREHDRVLTSPHIAYYSAAADVDRRRQAVANVRAVLEGQAPPHPVNDP